jgi:hypothetical protein
MIMKLRRSAPRSGGEYPPGGRHAIGYPQARHKSDSFSTAFNWDFSR